jgi:hypothetical protein
MKNQIFLKTLLVTALGVCPILCQADIEVQQCKQQVQKTAMQQNSATKGNMPMNAAEQQFAMKLSALHRQIFTTVFTPDLRKEAMAAMTSPDNDDEEMPMTEDMAVEQVITNHRDTTAMPKAAPAASTKQTKNTTTKKKSYWN